MIPLREPFVYQKGVCPPVKKNPTPQPTSLDPRKIRRAYAPYRREGRSWLLTMLTLCLMILLAWLWTEETVETPRNIAYLLVAMVFLLGIAIGKSRVAICSFYEAWKQCFVEQPVRIQQMKDDPIRSGRARQMLCDHYADLIKLYACRVIAVTPEGEQLRLLSAGFTLRREALMRVVARSEKESVMVVYGRYTRVIVGFRGAGYDGVDFERME